MSVGAESDRSQPHEVDPHQALRSGLFVLAIVLLVAWLIPPLTTLARRYECVEAVQFSFFLVVVPALAVIGAPWRRLGLASRHPLPEDIEGAPSGAEASLPAVDRLALGRRRHPEAWRAVCFAALYVAAAIVWRTPLAVNALAWHPWLVAAEALTLVAAGVALWLELVESPPLVPRLSRPNRIALAAVSMWVIWVLAYLVGLSHSSWFVAYSHHAGSGLSLSADQQLATGLMWFVSGCAFIPVVYWNLIRWLQSEEDPDEEMHKLVRQERIRGRTVEGGPAGL